MDASNTQLNAVLMESINGDEPYSTTNDDTNSSNNITYLGNPDLYCCHELFFRSIQDAGLPNVNSKTGCKNSRKPQKHISTKTPACSVGTRGPFRTFCLSQ